MQSAGSPAATSGDVTGLYGADTPRSDQCINRIRQWIQSCRHTHRRCRHTISGRRINPSNPPLPYRCIEIVSDQNQIRLSLKETAGQFGKYVTLSYRWDSTIKSSCTTVRNYQHRIEGRYLDQLPPLYMDLFFLTERLGIQYVWIDSLCIIQDSEGREDWLEESAKMAEYYQYSTLTIAAMFDDLRLFPPTQNYFKLPTLARLPYRDSNGIQKGHFYLYSKIGSPFSASKESELLRRAWVFQELYLSMRVACFTPTGIRLYCKSELARDGYSAGLFSGYLHPFDNRWLQRSGNHISLALDLLRNHVTQLPYSWRIITQIYSCLLIENATEDRIQALAGIASEFVQVWEIAMKRLARSAQKRRSAEQRPVRYTDWYIAGHWIEQIHDSLLWNYDPALELHSTGHRVVGQRVSGISTWSWASILIPISWRGSPDRGTPACGLIGVISLEKKLYITKPQPLEEEVCKLIQNVELPTSETPQRAPKLLGSEAPFRVLESTKSATLLFYGRLHPVLIRDWFELETVAGKVELSSISAATDDFTQFGETDAFLYNIQKMTTWRKVCSPRKQNIIIGWASFEHPEFQDNQAFRNGQVIYAFRVVEIQRHVLGWMVGSLSGKYKVYGVLFVRSRKDDDCFERVGAGRLWGPEVEQDYAIAVDRIIKLA